MESTPLDQHPRTETCLRFSQLIRATISMEVPRQRFAPANHTAPRAFHHTILALTSITPSTKRKQQNIRENQCHRIHRARQTPDTRSGTFPALHNTQFIVHGPIHLSSRTPLSPRTNDRFKLRLHAEA